MDPTQASLNRLQQLIDLVDSTLRLPNSPRAFAIYLLGLLIVFVGAFLHVLVAAQIMQAEFTLAQLQEEYRSVEQQNGDLIFQIARSSNMARLHQEIASAGYVPVKDREYIFVSSPAIATDTLATTPVTPATTELAAQPAEITAAAQPEQASPVARTNTHGSQWVHWEEFWRDTLGMSAARTPELTLNAAPARASATTPNNFWAVWWEQASAQGEKLLEQIRGQ